MRRLCYLTLLIGSFFLLASGGQSASAAPGINKTINFQGRLYNAQGATVPDGFYNVQFKIYQDGDGQTAGNTTGSPAGSLEWTESHLNSASQGVEIKNGFMSVELGSVTAFGSSIDWDQNTLWLSLNIGSTNGACTPFTSCTPDGEMLPMKRFSSVPYALNAGALGGKTSANFVQLAQGVQTDASTNTTSIFLNKTAGGNFLQLQSSAVDVFTLSNSGDITLGSNADKTISVGTAAASTDGRLLTVAAGAGGSGAGSAGGDLVLQGGAAGGTNGNGGDVTINAGAKTGSGTDGTVSIGTSNTSSIVLGQDTTLAANKSLTLTGGATRPTSPTEGMIFYDTAAKQLLTYANGKWQADRSTSTKIVAASNSSQALKDAADYVADGTGDQTEINNALTAAAGGKVYLMEGTYVVNATISIPNSTTLAGAGRGSLIELADLDATDNLIENTDQTTGSPGGTGVVIQDVRLDGRSDLNTAGTQYGIYLLNMGGGTGSTARQGAKINNVILSRFRSGNLVVDSSSNGTYSGINSQASGGNGFTIDSSSRQNTFTNNVAQGNTTNGFQITGGSGYNTFSGNVAQGNTSAGIATASASDNNTITGNNLRSNGTNGITIGASSSNTVSANTSVENTGDGINISTNANQNTVSGNTVNANGGDGIEINGSQYNSVNGNTSQGNTANGFTLVNASNNALNSNVSRSNSIGISLSGSSANTVGSNNLNTNSTYGIYLSTSNTNAVNGNRITDSGGASANNGIYLTAADSNTITSNTIRDASASPSNIAINIFNSTSDTNYLADNTTAGGSTTDAGTGTTFGGQTNAAGAFAIQNAGGVAIASLTGTATSDVTIVTGAATAGNSGNISLDVGTATGTRGTISIGTTTATTISIGNGSSTTTIQGNVGVTLNGTTGTTMVCRNVSGLLSSCDASYQAPTASNFIQNQNAGAQATSNFWVSGTGRADTGLLAPSLDVASAGTLSIGTTTATTVQVGSTTLSSGTQTINIGNNNTSGGTTNVTIGSGGSATGGTTSIQAKDSVAISTNGTTRATFNNANSVYFGNGVTAAAPNNFTISGTGSSTTAVSGASLTVQGGSATVGNANGGNLTLSGGTGVGTGVNGLVILTTPTFSTTSNDANCYTGGALVAASCTITTSSVNNSSAIIVGFNTTGRTATMPDPTTATAGRVVYVTAANGSSEFTLSVNGGGTGNQIAMRQNTTATMIWNGNDWTAAGASSSTTLQAAYNNTLTSAGGAELVVSSSANANGLTIRDDSTAPVNGTLLEVQTSSATNLFSVNSNVTEYAKNAGAEVGGGDSSTSDTTFPASTWSAVGATTIARYTTAGNYIATGQASVSASTPATANVGIKNQLTGALNANMTYNVSFTTRLTSGTFTDMNVYYSIDGTAASTLCTASATSITSTWRKVNCTFTAPSSGITSSNAILIRQTSATSRVFYVDNLSVTLAADFNYATDGTVNDAGNFATNWSAVGTSAVTRNTSDGQEASDSAQVVAGTTANNGVRNLLSVNPLTSTLYRVSVYAKLVSGSAFSDFQIRYTPDNGTSFVNCVDYNTQTVTTTDWTNITCYITTTATSVTTPYMQFIQPTAPGVARTYLVDTFAMTLSSASTPNVQIGGGSNGGPTTLFTLDRGAAPPIAANNEALLGSMYYDTTLGKLQCYEADGWGACGSSPDNIITISPEYTNAVLHGTGIGTMTSDLCSDTLNINDGSSGQATICGTNETYNFYKWNSPQSSAQTYGIYVTYQLPGTFKSFQSGQTSLMGRTDSANSTVNYQIYRNSATSGLIACGSTVSVSTGSQSAWQTGIATGAADPSTCNFEAGDSVVFKINITSSQNANAYVGNLNFAFSNR